jgi:hypothetical protein
MSCGYGGLALAMRDRGEQNAEDEQFLYATVMICCETIWDWDKMYTF